MSDDRDWKDWKRLHGFEAIRQWRKAFLITFISLSNLAISDKQLMDLYAEIKLISNRRPLY